MEENKIEQKKINFLNNFKIHNFFSVCTHLHLQFYYLFRRRNKKFSLKLKKIITAHQNKFNLAKKNV